MDYYAGIDVSLEQSSVCVVDAAGKIVCEAKVASEPEALVRFFGQLSMRVTRIGLEAGPLSQWLHAGLSEAGLETVLLETRHVKAALSAMIVKTDRKDARGIAHLLRMGWFRPVHRKSADAQEVRALLVGRKLLQSKLRDVEFSIRGILRGFGLKVGEVSKGRFAARVEELIAGHAMLEAVVGAMLTARTGLQSEFMRLHRQVLAIVRTDDVCRRLIRFPHRGFGKSYLAENRYEIDLGMSFPRQRRHIVVMSGRIFVAPHHSTEELERRYKAANDGIERGHLHIIWLLSQGRSAKFVAEVTGYTPTWVSRILWRYNDHGLAGLGDGRLDNPGAAPLLDKVQLEELRDMVSEPPPDGGLWTGRKVACWITGRIGRTVSPQRGVEYLRRLDLTRQVPRPANPKASLYEQVQFKKSSKPASPSSRAPKQRFRSRSGRSTNTASD